MQIPSFVCSGTMVIELHYKKKMDKMQVVNMFYAVKSDLKLKTRSEFPNVWGEYKNHSNPYDIQVNEKFVELKKGHIGIVEKAQETSSDSDMHNTVCLCHCCTS